MSENWMWTEKYRPTKLDEIVGQEPITERLKQFLVEHDLPHLLFSGPAGTGKTSAIIAFAHELYKEQFPGNFLELNASVAPETPIMIRIAGNIKRTNFDELAKTHFVRDEKYTKTSGVEILSIDKDYKVKFMPVGLISRHKVSKIAKIHYEGGKIRTSLNHSVIIMDDQGNLVTKEVSELNEGDLLITFRTTIKNKENKLIDFKKYTPQQYSHLKSGLVKNPKIKTILENTELDEDLAWLFGTYLAEGCLSFMGDTSGGLVFTFGNPNELDSAGRVQTILKEKFSLDSTTTIGYSGFDRSKGSSIQVRVYNTQLARFFKNNFYNGSKQYVAKTKRVPEIIYNSKYRWDFLKGYTHDATGEWEEYIRYTSRSDQNLVDITWLGRISGMETSCFKSEARIVWKLPNSSYIRTNLLPAAPIINILQQNDRNIRFNWRYALRHQIYSKRSKRVTKKLIKNLLNHIIDQIDKNEAQKIMKLVNSPLSAVIIKKIEVTEYNDFVYDVSVPGSEMFWGGTAPILLHNSDARGIDVVRNRVKNFARTRPLGDVPFKIVSLDEADSLTRDAQHALRRTMERFVTGCRFCLICNYSSRIIDPIQSRCAIFRFPRINEEKLIERISYIAKKEKVKLTEEGTRAILYVSGGDLRRAINVLQAASVTQKRVDADAVYSTTGKARPEDVSQMINSALNGKFLEAQEKLRNLLIWQGLAGTDIIRQVHREVIKLGIGEKEKIYLVDIVGEAEFRLTEGADPEIQLSNILAKFAQLGKSSEK